jgi:adenylate cyclase
MVTAGSITELSRFRQLLVISRNAVFVHKGKPVKAQQIAREFGVDYTVEGSVRKAGDRVRVTVQLINGESETHIWPERYDRKPLRYPGRGDVVDRLDPVRPRRGRKTPPGPAKDHRKPGGVRTRSDRKGPAPSIEPRDQRGGAAASRPGHRARSELCACACLEGVRGRIVMDLRLCEDRRAAEQTILGELQTALSIDDNDADVQRILAAANLTFNEHDRNGPFPSIRTANSSWSSKESS